MIPRIFDGRTVAIFAGGPSLTDFPWDEAKDWPCVAINRAHEFLPAASVLWWSDAEFFRRNRPALEAHRAPYKATCHLTYNKQEIPWWLHVYRFTGLSGFDDRADCLKHGNNSGYAAMHLAAHLGAARLILFGYDMHYGPKGETHFHGGHGLRFEERTLTELMVPHFSSLREPLAQRKIQVLNASPTSGLTVWKRCSIRDGIEAMKGAGLG